MHHNSNQQGSDMNIKQIFAKSLRTLLCCVYAILLAGCLSSPKENACMDRAESLMESAPDSAMTILDSISLGSLSSQKDKARYALLKSMALDKNYIDATSFDLLQPAIDYYLKQGSPDEKLRTLYYQGRIYQNREEDEEAMKSYVKGIELANSISDSLTLGRMYVAQKFLFEKQGMYAEYIQNSLKAYAIFSDLGNSDIMMTCLASAINGNMYLDNKEQADSLMKIATILESKYGEGNQPLLHSKIIYALDYSLNEDTEAFLDSIMDNMSHDWDDVIYLDIAYGYDRLGQYKKAIENLNKIGEIDKESRLKYLSIKYEIEELGGDYYESLQTLKNYIQLSDSVNNKTFSQEIASVEKNYALEKEVLSEKNDRRIILLTGICILLFFCISLILVLYWLRGSKLKNQILKEDNMRLEIETLRLKEENSKNELDRLNNIIESNKLREQITKLESERDGLSEILSDQRRLSDSVRKVLRERLELLNGLLAAGITSNDKYSKSYRKLENDFKNNKEYFLKNLRNTFELENPEFMAHLRECGLTEVELNYVCLYALGLRAKEIGDYLKTSRHYIISSEIRSKLGLSQNEENLGSYIQSQIKKYI